MIEESNNIVIAGGDVLVYLGKPMHKKHSTTFVSDHPLSTYISYDRFFFLLPLSTFVHILDDPPPSPLSAPSIPPVAYVLNGWSLSQPGLYLFTFRILEPYPSTNIVTLMALLLYPLTLAWIDASKFPCY